jgi:hypothetical protein
MAADFAATFTALKTVLANHTDGLATKTDTPTNYTLVSKSPSPFKQHKGHPMEFGAVKLGKAYVSFHLMPLYMSPAAALISAPLKKHMQGKTCFNFKTVPGPDLLAELARLTEAGFTQWHAQKWI